MLIQIGETDNKLKRKLAVLRRQQRQKKQAQIQDAIECTKAHMRTCGRTLYGYRHKGFSNKRYGADTKYLANLEAQLS
jgi:hypothetical protein